MQLLVTFDSNESFLTLDVGEDMTLRDLMGLIEIEGSIPADKQIVYYNAKQLTDADESLKTLGFTEGDMILVRNKEAVQAFLEQERARYAAERSMQPHNGDAEEADESGARFNETALYAGIEQVRNQMISSPMIKSGVLQRYPQLEEVIHSKEAFRAEMVKIERARYIQEEKRGAALKKLQEDPYDVESQQIILNHIRADAITENFNIAMEENPEVFASVTMLFINIRVNGHHVKAFVDSGAQATIMSPECAEACSLSHLIDKRFQGMAMGVGTAKILGRIHTAPLLVGDAVLAASFTVMEGKSVDFLLGLDLLKKYQAQIDLKRNVLVIADNEVPFLPESEIPKNFMEGHAPLEPQLMVPDSASSNTAAGSSFSHAAASAANVRPPSTPSQGGSSSKRRHIDPRTQQQQQQQQKHSEEVIANLIALGFTRAQVVGALDRHGGDPDLAAAQLFESS